MSKPSVYLAGPIKGLTFDEGQEWRDVITDMLEPEIDAFSPLRWKQVLRKEGIIRGSYEGTALSSAKGLTCRDRYDVTHRDLMVVNFVGWKSVSMGTSIELGWADAARKPVVGIGPVYDYPMVKEIVNFWAAELDEAVHIVKAILLPERGE